MFILVKIANQCALHLRALLGLSENKAVMLKVAPIIADVVDLRYYLCIYTVRRRVAESVLYVGAYIKYCLPIYLHFAKQTFSFLKKI